MSQKLVKHPATTTMIGRLVEDPRKQDLKKDDNWLAKARMAVEVPGVSGAGTPTTFTGYYDVDVWDGVMRDDLLALGKGDEVRITGALRSTIYDGKVKDTEEVVKRIGTTLHVNEGYEKFGVELLNKAGSNASE